MLVPLQEIVKSIYGCVQIRMKTGSRSPFSILVGFAWGAGFGHRTVISMLLFEKQFVYLKKIYTNLGCKAFPPISELWAHPSKWWKRARKRPSPRIVRSVYRKKKLAAPRVFNRFLATMSGTITFKLLVYNLQHLMVRLLGRVGRIWCIITC